MSQATVSFIVTCMGRLKSVQQTIVSVLAQPASEYVFVDWGCPEQSGGWVHSSYPTLRGRIVREPAALEFNLSAARNLGASHAQGAWLAFLDADHKPARNLVTTLLPSLKAEHFYFVRGPSLGGVLVCEASAFKAIDGYDDVMQGWGFEDSDIARRLALYGLEPTEFPAALISHVEHSSQDRVKHYSVKDLAMSMVVNATYSSLKIDLMVINDVVIIPRNFRQMLYTTVGSAWASALKEGKKWPIEVEVGTLELATHPESKRRLHVQRKIVYELEPPQEGGEA